MNRAWNAILRVVCGLFVVAWAALSLVPGDTLINGNFTSPLSTGWSTLGTASAVGTQGNVVPPVGSTQAMIASGNDSGQIDGRANTFTDTPIATLDSTLNLSFASVTAALPVSYTPPAFGSAIYQTFTALAGATLSFNWNYATNEEGLPTSIDAALYSLQQPGAAQAQVVALANGQTSTFVAAGASSPFVYMTGYGSTVNVILPTAGTYTVGFISLQTSDDFKSSGVYINNVQVVGGTPAPPITPAPAAWSLGLLGFGFIAIYSGVRRLRRAN